MRIETWDDLDDAARSAALSRPAIRDDESVRVTAAEIIRSVRSGGDAAIRAVTSKFDGTELDHFKVSESELSAAARELKPRAVAAIDLAIENVGRFHEAQMPIAIEVETMPGVSCKRLSHAIDSVGLYVPAGTAPLPSAAIMLAVPAAIAGCPTRIMCTPPRPDGTANPAVLVAASRSGVTDIYKVGGAQAIAAMAYGTETVPKVCKLFGPGNAWVTSAKTQVSSDPGAAAIDMPAGPSEVLVIADRNASAEFVAADLLSQAEHGIDSQVVLLTPSEELAQEVQTEIGVQLALLSRADIARQALQNSLTILVRNIETAIEISNRYAPEHLILQFADAKQALSSIRNAGSVFVGPWSPESVGDYCSGTNHVLPTYGAANAYSGLGVDQFMRQMTVQELTREGLAELGDAVVTLSELEGLDAHAAAVTRRLGASV
ncbi:MAG: histidinol dehydrogenase [Gammaproteobacteria bacterium]|nr:histidinol dehydrogenase [Gammaproteobacteria bacterium]MDH3415991.1 histidinol dehydrogenase [Gammaproteobacteria bacterium]